MISEIRNGGRTARLARGACLVLTVALSAAAAFPVGATGDDQRTFASPEQAGAALAAAWRSGSRDRLFAIFGPAGETLVSSGDPVADTQARDRLAASYAERHHIERHGTRQAIIVLGKNEWPYPIPLVVEGAGWHFDVEAGAEQIIDRRIGRNELNAIKICRAYVEAQRDYAAQDRLGDGLHEYAQKVTSSEGKHDGLYWQAAGNNEASPLGPLFAAAEAAGYGAASMEGRAPYEGYFFRILTRQGSRVPGGAQDYLDNGHLTKGFALIAFPAKYGDSGIMTFVVNQNGIVFEKNLGPDTADIARRLTEYDPDPTWQVSGP